MNQAWRERIPRVAIDVEVLKSEIKKTYAAVSEQHGFERIETGQLVDTYARSKFEDTRRKAQKFGARGTTLRPTSRTAEPAESGSLGRS
jgi:hypothetical protein